MARGGQRSYGNAGRSAYSGGTRGGQSRAVLVSGEVPANTVAPVASGNGTVGSMLSSTNGTWSNAPTGYTYQWRRDGGAIIGATGQTYVLAAADSGHSLTCHVSASNAFGAGRRASSNAIVVA